MYDTIIIGGGPAGFTAGLYAARSGMKVLLVESLSIMGQVVMTDIVENYPGIERIRGMELIEKFRKQAESFGLVIQDGNVERITEINSGGTPAWQISCEDKEHEALSLIIASGARPKKLGVPGEEKFAGKGISYCATCDGAFFRNKDIVVVGGGDTAIEEAIFLTRFAKTVTIIHRRDRLRAAKILQERATHNEKIKFVWNSIAEQIEGDARIKNVCVRNIKTNEKKEIPCDGVFIFVGWQPNTDFAKGVVELDEHGAIIVDTNMATSRKGIFACGDCCKKKLHQIVTACGDGALAATSASEYVDELKGVAYK